MAFLTSWEPSESDILQALKLEHRVSWEWNKEDELVELDELEAMDDDIDGEMQEILFCNEAHLNYKSDIKIPHM
jgi:hypothetical protein